MLQAEPNSKQPEIKDISDAVSVDLSNIDKSYIKGNTAVDVLKGVSLKIKKGEFIALMGPSGSGKTTLLNIIGGIDSPNSGGLKILGKTVNLMSRSEVAQWRAKEIGFIFQFYNLIPVLTAEQNIELPLELFDLAKTEIKRRVKSCLELVGLTQRAKHYPSELSGGQQQRVAIARAIITDPNILLCDEPTGDLDRETGESILELLKIMNTEFKKTIILVTHDPFAASYANRTVHLNKGVIERDL